MSQIENLDDTCYSSAQNSFSRLINKILSSIAALVVRISEPKLNPMS